MSKSHDEPVLLWVPRWASPTMSQSHDEPVPRWASPAICQSRDMPVPRWASITMSQSGDESVPRWASPAMSQTRDEPIPRCASPAMCQSRVVPVPLWASPTVSYSVSYPTMNKHWIKDVVVNVLASVGNELEVNDKSNDLRLVSTIEECVLNLYKKRSLLGLCY